LTIRSRSSFFIFTQGFPSFPAKLSLGNLNGSTFQIQIEIQIEIGIEIQIEIGIGIEIGIEIGIRLRGSLS